MYYTLLYYPNFDRETTRRIAHFRKKYDPHAGSWKPHITFVFPVHLNDINKKDIGSHFKEILSSWKAFTIQINGLEKAWDHWLFVLLKEGNKEVTELHDALYTGPLAAHLRKDIEYIPHIAIGLFTKKGTNYDLRDPKEVACDKELYKKGLQEAKDMKIDFTCKVDRLIFEVCNDDLTEVVESYEIKLKN